MSPVLKKFFQLSLFAGLVTIVIGTAVWPSHSVVKDKEEKTVADPYGRNSPRGTVDGYLKAMRGDDPAKASLFLDVRGMAEQEASRRASQLKRLLDDGGYFFLTDEISSNLEGNLTDEMNPDLEEVGALRINNGNLPLILQRISMPKDREIWLFSRSTIMALPALSQSSGKSLLDRILPEALKTYKFMSVPIGHWLAMCGAVILALILGMLLSRLALIVIRKMVASRIGRDPDAGLDTIRLPLALIIAIAIYRACVIELGVQVVARGATDWITVTLFWLATALLLIKIIDVLADWFRSALLAHQQRSSLAALILARKVIKAVIISMMSVQVLEILGFDVTTAIAALGIGGLALALGAQKTVENLVGSVNVVADQPVEVGDFCRFGDISGTVEDIGIRSTKIRTPARTIVTVPNGAFASMQIENFSVRDRFLFNPVLSLRCDTSAERLQKLIASIQDHLTNASTIEKGARVNLIEITRSSLEIEIHAYILANDFSEFVATKEALLFFLLEEVSASGSVMAFPPMQLQIASEVDVGK